jgi:hypothetical protein
LRLELTLPDAELRRGIQRAVDLVGFGLQAAEQSSIADLNVPGAFPAIVASPEAALDAAEAPSTFQSWVIANGLRDCVDAVGPALEWARRFCFFWTRDGTVERKGVGISLSARFSGEEWNRSIVQWAPT